jgi:PadR family transcriptional regulator PadR
VAKKKRVAGETDVYSGLIRIHVLHHACVEGVFGLGMINELRRHGYNIGPGTMYPLLHGMEKRGWLRARTARIDGRARKVYFATAAGKRTLEEAKVKVRELFVEIFEDEHHDSE